VVVGNLDVFRPSLGPPETDSILVIDSNAMLTPPFLPELPQSIPRGNAQVLKGLRLIQLVKLPSGDGTKQTRARLASALRIEAVEHILGAGVTEGLDHVLL